SQVRRGPALFSVFQIASNLTILFYIDTPTTDIYTLSLHDALPISSATKKTDVGVYDTVVAAAGGQFKGGTDLVFNLKNHGVGVGDRKSTRLNSSHRTISYAVFCLKKKKKGSNIHITYN